MTIDSHRSMFENDGWLVIFINPLSIYNPLPYLPYLSLWVWVIFFSASLQLINIYSINIKTYALVVHYQIITLCQDSLGGVRGWFSWICNVGTGGPYPRKEMALLSKVWLLSIWSRRQLLRNLRICMYHLSWHQTTILQLSGGVGGLVGSCPLFSLLGLLPWAALMNHSSPGGAPPPPPPPPHQLVFPLYHQFGRRPAPSSPWWPKSWWLCLPGRHSYPRVAIKFIARCPQVLLSTLLMPHALSPSDVLQPPPLTHAVERGGVFK